MGNKQVDADTEHGYSGKSDKYGARCAAEYDAVGTVIGSRERLVLETQLVKLLQLIGAKVAFLVLGQ